MKVLVACEFSDVVREAFTVRGHDALSCDLDDTEIPGKHYKGDVRDLLGEQWDMMIAFPPCTYLAYSGNAHWNKPGRAEKREEALEFVRVLMNAPVKRIAIENPLGCISRMIRKPDQIIEPYYFGEGYTKRTCLWLKGLPPLMATCVNLEREVNVFVLNASGGKNRAKNRSRTFPLVARAMAEQWG